MIYNSVRPPFDDVRVRHALYIASHRRPFVTTFSEGVDYLGGPFPPNAWYGIPEDELVKMPGFRETPDGGKHPDDIAMARALLEEAGVEEGFEVEIFCGLIFEFCDVISIYADQLETYLGWKTTQKSADVVTWITQAREGQFVLSVWGFGIVAHDPHDFFAGFYTEGSGNNNWTNWSHPRIEEIFDEQARELDRTKRKALIDEATQIFMTEDSPVIIMYHTVRGHYSALQIQNHHPVGTLSDALKAEHFWCSPGC